MEQIKVGDCITITERKCSEKVQPNIQIGDIYLVHAVDKTTTGTEVLVVYRNKKEYRCNADRFGWKYWDAAAEKKRIRSEKLAAMDVMFHNAQKAAWEKEKTHLLHDFTFAEQAKISYVPLIVYYIAWEYAGKATAYAAAHRIEEVKKLSRAVKMLQEKYTDYLRQDLDLKHIEQVRDQSKRFMDDHQLFFTQFFYTVVNAVNHQHIGIAHDELSAYAFISKVLLSFLFEFENEMTALIRQRLGRANECHLPHQEALRSCMDAYIGNQTIGMTNEIETALRVFANEINKIEYVIRP